MWLSSCGCQEYQDHHSEEEDADLYEKIGIAERDDKLGGGVDKRRRKFKDILLFDSRL